MKENDFTIESDGVCLYITIAINANLPAKLILISLNLILMGVIILAMTEAIIFLAIISTLIAILLLKFTLWNFFGKELLIINTKIIKYQHDYGFFRTNSKLQFIQKGLSVVENEVAKVGNNAQLRLEFLTFNEYDLPEQVYHTVLPISQKDANELNKAINSLFIEKVAEDYSLPPIFMN